jgi:hypothetical protein
MMKDSSFTRMLYFEGNRLNAIRRRKKEGFSSYVFAN